VYITDLSQVEKGFCGIPEPVFDEPIAQDKTALVLMPGLAFDREGHRLGYGGGYYDKYFCNEPEHPMVALCYSFQMVDKLETEAFDIPVDLVICAEEE
jgi:5-formyltetrahydrofolate cyclo-ligase